MSRNSISLAMLIKLLIIRSMGFDFLSPKRVRKQDIIPDEIPLKIPENELQQWAEDIKWDIISTTKIKTKQVPPGKYWLYQNRGSFYLKASGPYECQ